MMNNEQQTHWEKVKHFELDDPQSAYAFSDRLARENGWEPEYTYRVIEEYKKFMFLICFAPHPLTPSDQVDQAWHLHLLYTRSYWDEFCDKVLEKRIHHGPTKGGKDERTKYHNLYELTQQFYQSVFGHAPPADIWPDGKKRFREIDFMRINTQHHWIIKKPKFLSI